MKTRIRQNKQATQKANMDEILIQRIDRGFTMRTTGVLERVSGFLQRRKRIRRAAVGIVGAVCLAIALVGCASTPASGSSDASLYNINTGYVEMPYPPHTP